MRSALSIVLTGILLAARFAAAQTVNDTEIVNPFEQRDPGRISASIGDDDATTDEQQSRFAFPTISLPKLPKPQMPEWKMPQWKMPKIELPKLTESRTTTTMRRTGQRQTSELSAWDKFNQNTKSFFDKTRTTLMPWTVDDEPAVNRSVTGSRMRTATRNNRSSAPSKPLLPFLPTNNDDEQDRIQSTTDFLSLPRPQYE